MIIPSQGLSFDDVLLLPKQGVVESRSEVDLSTNKFFFPLRLPIMASPMSCVTGPDMAIAIARAGGLGFIHRFCSIEEQVRWFKYASKKDVRVGCAIGIKEGYDRYLQLFEAGCSCFVIDVAHGHSLMMEKFIDYLPHTEEVYLMAGSIATAEGASFLLSLGVNAVRVGVGSGAACSTRLRTGFGNPQLSAVIEVAEALENTEVFIVSDGGIRSSGDIAKALAAGADAVMIGRLFAGADEAPYFGRYFGMASSENDPTRLATEGEGGDVPSTGPIAQTIEELKQGLQSAISYGGGRNIDEFRENAEFRLVSSSTHAESGVRI